MPRKGKKIVIREINLKKAVIVKAIWMGALGLILGVIAALGVLPIPVLGVFGAIGLVILTPIVFAILSAICTAICVMAINLGLKYADGFELEVEF